MAEAVADPAVVRRLEAAGSRAWPAATTHYDGAWAIRLTADLPARRLNSINPLDRDENDLDARIDRARARFAAMGRRAVFRMTPLAGDDLAASLEARGWTLSRRSLVMQAQDLAAASGKANAAEEVDPAAFARAAVAIGNLDAADEAGFARFAGAIGRDVGFLHLAVDGQPVANAICVRDGALAGLFEVAVAPSHRGAGHGRAAVDAALDWARIRGARRFWLQVEAGNEPAIGLYRSLGFETVYDYHYRADPGGEP